MTMPAPRLRDDLVFRVDDLTGAATQGLIVEHLTEMHATSPAESVHALDLDRLRDPAITFWSGWIGDELAVMGALQRLDAANGELKSMRTSAAARGTGAGRAILRHIVAAAAAEEITTLWLETGAEPHFAPARALYASEGFAVCGPFASYRPDPNSVFMTRRL